MTWDQAGDIIGLLGGLTLVISALVARRLPRQRWLSMALMWAAIFALLFTIAIILGR